jgi:lipoprotein-releasing system permease protein
MVNLLLARGQEDRAGFAPKIVPFRVAGIFRTGMYEYDSSLGYVTIARARTCSASRTTWPRAEIRLTDVDDAQEVAKLCARCRQVPLYVRTWMDMNANLFAALKLEKTAMFIILAMIVLVRLVLHRHHPGHARLAQDQGYRRAHEHGAPREGHPGIFMLRARSSAPVGTVARFALGLPASLLLKKYQFIELPPGVYPVDLAARAPGGPRPRVPIHRAWRLPASVLPGRPIYRRARPARSSPPRPCAIE